MPAMHLRFDGNPDKPPYVIDTEAEEDWNYTVEVTAEQETRWRRALEEYAVVRDEMEVLYNQAKAEWDAGEAERRRLEIDEFRRLEAIENEQEEQRQKLLDETNGPREWAVVEKAHRPSSGSTPHMRLGLPPRERVLHHQSCPSLAQVNRPQNRRWGGSAVKHSVSRDLRLPEVLSLRATAAAAAPVPCGRCAKAVADALAAASSSVNLDALT